MLYIHIPFCKQRCIYCDFYSTTLSPEFTHSYVEAVENEINDRHLELPSHTLSSVYIGGGTPSLLPIDAIHKLFTAIRSRFVLAHDAEITFEVNPDDVKIELIKVLKSEGVNRISLGVQSFNDNQLHLLNRRHSSAQAVDAVNLIHQMGIQHINLDLIYGQPRQTLEMWTSDVRQALSLPIDHLSAYALTVEESTKLQHMLKKGIITMPSEDDTLSMYKILCQEAEQRGFQHYEISNFSLPNAHSRHNCGYWQNKHYLGIGPGAHSYDGKTRKINPQNIHQYIASCGIINRQVEELTVNEQCNDLIITSLRTRQGLNLQTFFDKFGPQRTDKLLTWASPHIQRKSLTREGHTLRLTENGIFISNDIISDLMFVDSD